MEIYHENGKLEQIGNYKNGKLEGEWKFYHNNGKLEQIGNYKNGKHEKENMEIIKMEMLEGEWKFYRMENGKLKGIRRIGL